MKRSGFLWIVLVLCTGGTAAAQPYYVATDGDDAQPGTEAVPFATVTHALSVVVPGDTIYMRGGTYALVEALRIDQSGTEEQYLHLRAYPGEEPILDFAGAPRGINLRGSYVHLAGLVVQNAEDNGVYVKGASHNVIERVVARYNGDSGVQVEDGSAHNLLLNVDSYENYDPQNHGENADGFAIKFGVGPGNVLRGCRAWGNSDDGFDFWSRDDPGQQGVMVEGSWAFNNGHNTWNDPDFQGDSNGFKLGHGPGAHVLVRNLAWGHRAHGFDVNGNLSGVTLYNNTAYANAGRNFNFDHDRNVEQGTSVLRNNVSVGGDVRMDVTVVDDQANSWNGVNAGSADFLSLDDAGAKGPRQPDGSLPALDFLHLAPGSDLIDAGMDVGFPYAGHAPDLGAFEAETGTAVAGADEVPSEVRLFPNYPNPFRALTYVSFAVSRTKHVRLVIYDALGRRVATLLDEVVPAGRHTVTWYAAASEVASGVYYARMEAGQASAGMQMVVLK